MNVVYISSTNKEASDPQSLKLSLLFCASLATQSRAQVTWAGKENILGNRSLYVPASSAPLVDLCKEELLGVCMEGPDSVSEEDHLIVLYLFPCFLSNAVAVEAELLGSSLFPLLIYTRSVTHLFCIDENLSVEPGWFLICFSASQSWQIMVFTITVL